MKTNSIFCCFRNYQYGSDGSHKNVKDLLRMESDDSDSELDIETSTTPDNVSITDGCSGGSSGGNGGNLTGKLEIKPELGLSPNAENPLHSVAFGGNSAAASAVVSNALSQQQQTAAVTAAAVAAAGTVLTTSPFSAVASRMAAVQAAGGTPVTGTGTPLSSAGATNPAAAAAAAAAAVAAASGGDYASLAAKNWLKQAGDPAASLHSFFMPFSAAGLAAAAAAHHAHLPFPNHHFNSQGPLFHVKDSV